MKPKQIFADYFTSFRSRLISGQSNTWRYYCGDKVQWSGDLYTAPGAKNKQIASPFYPLIGTYDTLDPDVLEYHILLAKCAGLDGFLCEYDIGHGHDSRVPLVMAHLGRKYNFKVGIHWVPINFTNRMPGLNDRVQMLAAAKKCLQDAMKNIYALSGACIDGRPLVLFFNIRAADYLPTIVKDTIFSASELAALRESVKAYQPIFLTPHFQTELIPYVDGFYPWVLPYGSYVPPDSTYDKIGDVDAQKKHLHHFYSHARQACRDRHIDYFLGSVWPGFDDHRGRAWGEDLARQVPRHNGEMLKLTWEMAKASQTDTLMQITWNDWVESSMIEPSVEFGYKELALTQKAAAQWKGLTLPPSILELPGRLFNLRKKYRRFVAVHTSHVSLRAIKDKLDQTAFLLSRQEWQRAAENLEMLQSPQKQYAFPAIVKTRLKDHWQANNLSSTFSLPEPEIPANISGAQSDPVAAQYTRTVEFTWQASSAPKAPLVILHGGRITLSLRDYGNAFLSIRQQTGGNPVIGELACFRFQNSGQLKSFECDLLPQRWRGEHPQLRFRLDFDSPDSLIYLHRIELTLTFDELPGSFPN